MPVVERPGAAEEVERWWEAIFSGVGLFCLGKRGGGEVCRDVTRVCGGVLGDVRWGMIGLKGGGLGLDE